MHDYLDDIVTSLSRFPDDRELTLNACFAICNVSAIPANSSKLVAMGVLPLVVGAIEKFPEFSPCKALSSLCGNRSSMMIAVKECSAVSVIVAVLRSAVRQPHCSIDTAKAIFGFLGHVTRLDRNILHQHDNIEATIHEIMEVFAGAEHARPLIRNGEAILSTLAL